MASKIKSVTFKNITHTKLFSNEGYKNNNTLKNTKTGHSTVEANYNAEKGRINALKKKEIRAMFTPIWMKLYKEISEKDERFHKNTEEADIVLADLEGVLRSTAKGRAKRITDMNISNAEKIELAKESIKEFVERASTLTYDMILDRIKYLEKQKLNKSVKTNTLSGKKRTTINNKNNRSTKKTVQNKPKVPISTNNK